MDELGQRIIRDSATVLEKHKLADDLEKRARELRSEADEIERLMNSARLQR